MSVSCLHTIIIWVRTYIPIKMTSRYCIVPATFELGLINEFNDFVSGFTVIKCISGLYVNTNSSARKLSTCSKRRRPTMHLFISGLSAHNL